MVKKHNFNTGSYAVINFNCKRFINICFTIVARHNIAFITPETNFGSHISNVGATVGCIITAVIIV